MNDSSIPTQQQNIMTDCFLSPVPCLYLHVHMLLTNKDAYLATVKSMCKKGIFATLSEPVKRRTFVALHLASQPGMLEHVLPHWQVVEITKGLLFLDRPRLERQLEGKIKELEDAHPHLKTTSPNKRRKRKIDRLRNELATLQQDKGDASHTHKCCAAAHANSAVQELIGSASVSGALARKIRKWAKLQSKDFLEFVVLTMPMDNWKKLADLVHFAPTDFSLPYFLSAVHGEPLPEGCFVQGMRTLMNSKDNLAERFQSFAKEHPQVYLAFNFLRTQQHLLQNREIAEDLARHIPLGTAIWYLEELEHASKEIPDMIKHRLQTEDWMADESSKAMSSFGKLLERLLTFQSRNWSVANELMVIAERRLSALKELYGSSDDDDEQSRHDSVSVVFVDASSSMTPAIQAGAIFSTMCSASFGAEIVFFNHGFVPSPHLRPSTVQDVLDVCKKIRASGATSLAAALWPYYEQKRKIDRIVLVTDEEENTQTHGFFFAQLLKAYKEHVHADVELIIICVDSGDSRFRKSLVDCGIDCKRMEIDGRRPDLTKFDGLLGQIAMTSSSPAASEQASLDDSQQRARNVDDNEFVLV